MITVPGKYIFISYAFEDKAIAERITKIVTSLGIDVWVDLEQLTPGKIWDSEIRRAIDGSVGALFLASKTSLTKDGYIKTELDLLLKKQSEFEESEVFLIPVIVDECEFLASRIAHLQWLEFQGPISENIGQFTHHIANSYKKLLESSERQGERVNTPEKKNGPASPDIPYNLAKSTTAKLFEPDELDIYCNKGTGEVFIFHGKKIDKKIHTLRYLPDDHSVIVEMLDGRKLDLGVKIQWLIRPYFTAADGLQFVRTKDGDAIDGFSVPLIVPSLAKRYGFKRYLHLMAAKSRGLLKSGDPTKNSLTKRKWF